jgi:hypothetical protein
VRLGIGSRAGAVRSCDVVAFLPLARHTGVATADQLEMISTDPRVMYGQAVIAGTRVPVSVILDRNCDSNLSETRNS